MAATETEMPEKMMMKKSVRVRVIWHSRKLSWESWLRGTRRPSSERAVSLKNGSDDMFALIAFNCQVI
ncbi:hypothetical protein PO909_020385 [Leuciscus waleckii]